MDKTEKQKKLIVWEPNGGGHRFMYVKFIARYALANGIPFEIYTTTEAIALPEWKVHGLDAYPHGTGESLADIVKVISLEPEYNCLLIVPDADRWLLQCMGQWNSLHRLSLSLLIMRPVAGKSLSSRINHLAKLALLATIRLTFTRVSIFALTSHGMRLPTPYRALGIKSLFDPVEWNPTMNRGELGLTQDQLSKTLFLVAGELSERKYILEIVAAWDSVKPNKALLVLVGRVSTTIASELDNLINSNHTILYIDDYVSNEAFDSWINAADYVFVLHRNVASSGVSHKASLSSHATVVCGGLQSNVHSIQSLGARYTNLETISIDSISNFFNDFDHHLKHEGMQLNLNNPKTWAEVLSQSS